MHCCITAQLLLKMFFILPNQGFFFITPISQGIEPLKGVGPATCLGMKFRFRENNPRLYQSREIKLN